MKRNTDSTGPENPRKQAKLRSAEAVLRNTAKMVCWRIVAREPNPEGEDCKCFSCTARAYFTHNYPEKELTS